VIGVVVTYYVVALVSLNNPGSGTGRLESVGDADGKAPTDRVTVEIEAVTIDPSGGSLEARLRPVPHGDLEGARSGQLREPLHLQVGSPGQAPAGFDFPADQVIDPVTAALGTDGLTQHFPFDKQQLNFHVEALLASEAVPIGVEMTDEVEGWVVSGTTTPDRHGVAVEANARREMLAITFALFYIAGTVVVTLVAVAVIVGAARRRQVDFERVIWLGAMLVVIPAVRNEMPGVPPIGTTVDLFVFLPSVMIVAVALLATIALLVLEEVRPLSAAAEGS
jgi:hypothetical protein